MLHILKLRYLRITPTYPNTGWLYSARTIEVADGINCKNTTEKPDFELAKTFYSVAIFYECLHFCLLKTIFAFEQFQLECMNCLIMKTAL